MEIIDNFTVPSSSSYYASSASSSSASEVLNLQTEFSSFSPTMTTTHNTSSTCLGTLPTTIGVESLCANYSSFSSSLSASSNSSSNSSNSSSNSSNSSSNSSNSSSNSSSSNSSTSSSFSPVERSSSATSNPLTREDILTKIRNHWLLSVEEGLPTCSRVGFVMKRKDGWKLDVYGRVEMLQKTEYPENVTCIDFQYIPMSDICGDEEEGTTLTKIRRLKRFKNLEELRFSRNELNRPSQLLGLRHLANIRKLFIFNNPIVCEKDEDDDPKAQKRRYREGCEKYEDNFKNEEEKCIELIMTTDEEKRKDTDEEKRKEELNNNEQEDGEEVPEVFEGEGKEREENINKADEDGYKEEENQQNRLISSKRKKEILKMMISLLLPQLHILNCENITEVDRQNAEDKLNIKIKEDEMMATETNFKSQNSSTVTTTSANQTIDDSHKSSDDDDDDVESKRRKKIITTTFWGFSAQKRGEWADAVFTEETENFEKHRLFDELFEAEILRIVEMAGKDFHELFIR